METVMQDMSRSSLGAALHELDWHTQMKVPSLGSSDDSCRPTSTCQSP